MLKIETFTCNMLQENCYVVSDETKECVIIDCGAYTEAEKLAIEKYINENELRPAHLIAMPSSPVPMAYRWSSMHLTRLTFALPTSRLRSSA